MLCLSFGRSVPVIISATIDIRSLPGMISATITSNRVHGIFIDFGGSKSIHNLLLLLLYLRFNHEASCMDSSHWDVGLVCTWLSGIGTEVLVVYGVVLIDFLLFWITVRPLVG